MNKNLFKCRQCGGDIYFDNLHVSEKTGKKIPLNPETEKHHFLPVPFIIVICYRENIGIDGGTLTISKIEPQNPASAGCGWYDVTNVSPTSTITIAKLA